MPSNHNCDVHVYLGLYMHIGGWKLMVYSDGTRSIPGVENLRYIKEIRLIQAMLYYSD